MIYLPGIPGWENLDPSFCNNPVDVCTTWYDEPMAIIRLCGRNVEHEGDCDPIPPLSEFHDD